MKKKIKLIIFTFLLTMAFTKIITSEAKVDQSWSRNESFRVDGFFGYYNADKTACRIQYCEFPTEVIIIPENINGVSVVALGGETYDDFYICNLLGSFDDGDGNAGEKEKKVKKVILPETLELIEEYCFRDFSSLTSIKLPKNLKTIKGYVFENCNSLTEITLPSYVINISDTSLFKCTSLKKIDVEDGNRTYSSTGELVLNKEKTKVVLAVPNLNSVVIPESVTVIGTGAFYYNLIKSVILPGKLNKIESGAFWGCKNLNGVSMPNKLRTIEYGAFSDCFQLRWIKLNKTLKKIGAYAFAYCLKLKNITIPASVNQIGEYAFTFNHKKLKIKVSKKNKKYCTVKGSLCMKKTKELLSFSCYKKIITIPYRIKVVSNRSYYKSLRTGYPTSIVFPSTITKLMKDWNNYLSPLKTITFKERPPRVLSGSMNGKKKVTVKVPAKSLKAYKKALKGKLVKGSKIIAI